MGIILLPEIQRIGLNFRGNAFNPRSALLLPRVPQEETIKIEKKKTTNNKQRHTIKND